MYKKSFTDTTYFTGEFIGSRKEHIYIGILSTFTPLMDHSGVNLVNVSLGNFAQYLFKSNFIIS